MMEKIFLITSPKYAKTLQIERAITSYASCQVIQQWDFIVLMSISDYSVMSYPIFVFFYSLLVCSNDTLEISYFSQL